MTSFGLILQNPASAGFFAYTWGRFDCEVKP
jgi:hypothetical protein